MEIKIEELEMRFSQFKEDFNSGRFKEASAALSGMLEWLEERITLPKAGEVDNRGNIKGAAGDKNVIISLNHVMEYYIYAYYYKPEAEVTASEIPIGEYYRTHGDLCIKLGRFKEAMESFKKAICYNPVDLDAILGLGECYKNLNMIDRYLIVTKQAYRYCCTRATMARYYRNMGFYYLSKLRPEVAKACYIYSNIYYETDNAKQELSYIEEAMKAANENLLADDSYTIPMMQEMFAKEGIEPGPDSDTIGVVYRVGELMMEDGQYKLAKDCLSIVYDITREEQLESVLDELERACDKQESL